jgi:hypothetical protein
MRSELVFKASESVDNRFLLCRLVSLSTKRLHLTQNCFQDTINDVLEHVTSSSLERLVRTPLVVEEPVLSEPPILLAEMDVA